VFLVQTVFTDVTPQMAVWREEIFGPVLAVMTFRTEADALLLANDSPFGLAAAVRVPPLPLPQQNRACKASLC
jgi:betaine-aldehyde dehydrogenase